MVALFLFECLLSADDAVTEEILFQLLHCITNSLNAKRLPKNFTFQYSAFGLVSDRRIPVLLDAAIEFWHLRRRAESFCRR